MKNKTFKKINQVESFSKNGQLFLKKTFHIQKMVCLMKPIKEILQTITKSAVAKVVEKNCK